jgi:hypothetical protein
LFSTRDYGVKRVFWMWEDNLTEDFGRVFENYFRGDFDAEWM